MKLRSPKFVPRPDASLPILRWPKPCCAPTTAGWIRSLIDFGLRARLAELGLNPDLGTVADAEALGGGAGDDEWIGGFQLEQPPIVLRARVGVAGFLPVD